MATENPTEAGGSPPPTPEQLRTAREDAAAIRDEVHGLVNALHRRASAGDPSVLDLRTDEEREAYERRRDSGPAPHPPRHLGRELRWTWETLGGQLPLPRDLPSETLDLYAATHRRPSWEVPGEGDTVSWARLLERAALTRLRLRQTTEEAARHRLAGLCTSPPPVHPARTWYVLEELTRIAQAAGATVCEVTQQLNLSAFFEAEQAKDLDPRPYMKDELRNHLRSALAKYFADGVRPRPSERRRPKRGRLDRLASGDQGGRRPRETVKELTDDGQIDDVADSDPDIRAEERTAIERINFERALQKIRATTTPAEFRILEPVLRHGLDPSEVADSEGITAACARKRLQRARSKLRELF